MHQLRTTITIALCAFFFGTSAQKMDSLVRVGRAHFEEGQYKLAASAFAGAYRVPAEISPELRGIAYIYHAKATYAVMIEDKEDYVLRFNSRRKIAADLATWSRLNSKERGKTKDEARDVIVYLLEACAEMKDTLQSKNLETYLYDCQQALVDYPNAVLTYQPKNALANYYRAYGHILDDQPERALLCFKKAIRYSRKAKVAVPNPFWSTEAYVNIANIQSAELKQHELALKTIDKGRKKLDKKWRRAARRLENKDPAAFQTYKKRYDQYVIMTTNVRARIDASLQPSK